MTHPKILRKHIYVFIVSISLKLQKCGVSVIGNGTFSAITSKDNLNKLSLLYSISCRCNWSVVSFGSEKRNLPQSDLKRSKVFDGIIYLLVLKLAFSYEQLIPFKLFPLRALIQLATFTLQYIFHYFINVVGSSTCHNELYQFSKAACRQSKHMAANQLTHNSVINSLWPSDAIWRQWSRSTLMQVMACCLTAPSHYLNQCWLIVTKVAWC